jgi:hypothetical protein
MSQTHVKPGKRPAASNSVGLWRWPTAIIVLSVAAMLLIVWLNARIDYVTTRGNVLETRIDVVGRRDSQQGGYILYQTKALVRYHLGDEDTNRWMPASDLSSSRDLLEVSLADHPKSCFVTWQAGYPENPRCQFMH